MAFYTSVYWRCAVHINTQKEGHAKYGHDGEGSLSLAEESNADEGQKHKNSV